MIAKLLIIHFILHNSTDEKLHSEKLEDVDDVDDFKVNVQMFSRSPTPTNDNSSDSSINPMKGLQMAEFAFSDDDQPDDVLANNRLEDKLKSLTVSGKDVRSVVNDLSEAAEVLRLRKRSRKMFLKMKLLKTLKTEIDQAAEIRTFQKEIIYLPQEV